MTKSELKTKIEELTSQISTLEFELSQLFDTELLALMQTEQVDRVEMGINNHEFNDGEATYFSLYYEDLTISKDDKECDGYENKELEPIRRKFVSLFDGFQDIFEDKFGDAYESIIFSVKNNKLVWK